MAGKFEVYEDRSGKYRFRLKAGNGEIVASGEAYETKASAKAGCEAVQPPKNPPQTAVMTQKSSSSRPPRL